MPRPVKKHRSRRISPGVESLEARVTLSAGLQEFSGPFSVPVAIVNGPDGNLWVLDQGVKGQSDLVVIAPDLTVKAVYPVPTANAAASSLRVGPDGNLWFVETLANKVGSMTPGGVFHEYAIPTTLQNLPGSGAIEVAAAPTDLVSGADGAIWFTEASAHKIGRITTDGTLTEIPTGDLQPGSIALGADSHIWFTDTRYDSSIDRLNADKSIASFAIPTHFASPIGLTPGPDGELWFAEATAGAIGRVTMSGTVTETKIQGNMPSPQRLAFDRSGNLWVTGTGAGLLRISPSGATTAFGPAPTAIGSLAAITVGPDGSVWVTDTGRDQIGRLSPSPSATSSGSTSTSSSNSQAGQTPLQNPHVIRVETHPHRPVSRAHPAAAPMRGRAQHSSSRSIRNP